MIGVFPFFNELIRHPKIQTKSRVAHGQIFDFTCNTRKCILQARFFKYTSFNLLIILN